MENLKIGKFSTLGLDKLPTHNVVAQKMDTIEFDKFPVSEAEAEPDARNIDFKFNYKQKRVAANFKRNVHPPTPVFTTAGDAGTCF